MTPPSQAAPAGPAELPKTYDPAAVEKNVLRQYQDAKAFHAEPTDPGDPYAIVIPPPNVTAALHLGHALNNTLQDILVRHARMAGKNAVWLPGTDHAGIATQTVVDKRLQQSGQPALKDYKRLEAEGQDGRSQFIEKVQAWKDEYEARITDQLLQMGCSCDFDRQRFTMDPVCARAVREAFFQLFKDGLIYRGKRLVNWDPVTQTALADDEVEMQTVDGQFYYLKYPLVHPKRDTSEPGSMSPVSPAPSDPSQWEETGEFVTVATTRPETMLGDTAVAVNPNDPERAKHAGQFVKLPIVGRIIPIVADDYVVVPDPESDDAKASYASGYLKVTPAHDPNDYDIGQRHDLPVINVMAPDGSISKDHGWPPEENPAENNELQPFLGLSREDARKAVVRWFRERELLADQKPYRHAVGHSYRSHVPVEPYLSDQWYVRVTDDRLAGAALRAMADDQRTPDTACVWSDVHPFTNSNTSREREGAGPPPNTLKHYLITFTAYGTWLHHDARGSVDRHHNLPGEPYVPENAAYEQADQNNMAGDAVTLDEAQRKAVLSAIQEVCAHRGWGLYAANVRTNHVHLVVSADASPEKVMGDCKAYATRRLREQGLSSSEERTWTRHGSTRYLNDDHSLAAARQYVVEEQGEDLGASFEHPSGAPLPHGRGSSQAPAGPSTGLTFHPPRYAKAFQTWHENIRDWCISRQLWWGHRIPVWSRHFNSFEKWIGLEETDGEKFNLHDELSDRVQSLEDSEYPERVATRYVWDSDPDRAFHLTSPEAGGFQVFVCVLNATNEAPETYERNIVELLEDAGFTQDPDVLDTWFSSALWPLSTLGWPAPEDFPKEFPDADAALQVWNPSAVLCTAREIITLWVSRMTMFNLYFRGSIPFHDVFIHAMIQDGHGQKMSKSLGNGVDPNDIIHSHGADAMRFTLTHMTTQTQDVRMPVDCVDPHTGETFAPQWTTGAGGARVMAPTQERHGKAMTTAYGVASGKAQPTDNAPLARNTSEKFDLGQRFCNKLWNALRFALGHLSDSSENDAPLASCPEALPSRWILSRLCESIRACDAALDAYRFADYASAVYDFVWRDLCDWYIEAVKPTLGRSPEQRAVLTACLDATLRLLHPIAPLITERLWVALDAARPGDPTTGRGLPGLSLPPIDAKRSGGLLIDADWPAADPAVLRDPAAEADWKLLQQTISALRESRMAHKVAPRDTPPASIRCDGPLGAVADANRDIVAALSGCEITDIGGRVERPRDAAASLLGTSELYLHGVLDPDTERKRLTKRAEELAKFTTNLDKRLSNEKYVANAPAKLVEESRAQLDAARQEAAAVQRQLDDLD
ncbi:MAG: class I tRNA ligase family protein [Planctomycetota bacterium]